MTIRNAKDILLDQMSGTLPQMGATLLNWFVNITLIIITKTTVNFSLIETKKTLNFRGIWQPLSFREINLKPKGQRDWAWFSLHCELSETLKNDDIVVYKNTRYRVWKLKNFTEYGYFEYHLSEDYEGNI